MASQPSLNFDSVTFSRSLSQLAKEHGLQSSADSRKRILDTAKEVARSLARMHGRVDADMVQAELMQIGITPEDLGNAAGSIFRGKHWRCVGRKPSTRVSRHGNEIRIWSLIGGE